jgi:phospholipase C
MPPTFDRRRFLQSSAALVGGGLVAPATRAVLPHAAGALPATRRARLTDIDHIIILMKENRSFDHYFGTLAGVRGFADAGALQLPGQRSVFHQPDGVHPDGYVLPFRLDTVRTSAQRMADLNHSWGPQHGCWNQGAMDAWVRMHRKVDGDNGPLTMGYLTRADLPYYHALADAFTLCDGYHASMFGPTHPNRIFLMTGSIDADGAYGKATVDNSGRGFGWQTYPERLERAGITWRVYHDYDDFGCNVLKYFTAYANADATSALREHALRARSHADLLHDLATGNLPQVSWIVPTGSVSEHPDFTPAAGENHTHELLAALWSNPKVWARTVVVINYDENDGLFDHVAPPTPPPGTPGEYVNGLPVGLGFRVPCMVISPFSRGGYVVSDTFDHTSTLRLIETRFGVEVPNLSRWRRETCGDLTATLGLGEPPRFDVPALPETVHRLAQVERTAGTLPPPQVPVAQALPAPEIGARLRRGALPTATT